MNNNIFITDDSPSANALRTFMKLGDARKVSRPLSYPPLLSYTLHRSGRMRKECGRDAAGIREGCGRDARGVRQ